MDQLKSLPSSECLFVWSKRRATPQKHHNLPRTPHDWYDQAHATLDIRWRTEDLRSSDQPAGKGQTKQLITPVEGRSYQRCYQETTHIWKCLKVKSSKFVLGAKQHKERAKKKHYSLTTMRTQ